MKMVPVKYSENIILPNNNYKADTAMIKAAETTTTYFEATIKAYALTSTKE